MTGHARALPPTSPFAGDDGACDPALDAALAALADGGPLEDVVRVLSGVRVLVPVLAEHLPAATGGAVDSGGPADPFAERAASAGVVALRAPDGRTALPVFSSVAALAAWRSHARPVPTAAPRAALAAVTEQWELVVLDPGGPVTALLPRPAVWALAQGLAWEPAVVGRGAERRVAADVAVAVAGAVRDVRAVQAVTVEPGRRAEVAVVLTLETGLDRAGLDAALAEVNAALAADATVAARVDSLELVVRGGR